MSKSLKNQVYREADMLDPQVFGEVHYQVDDQIWYQVWIQVGDQVKSRVFNQVVNDHEIRFVRIE
jgi:hypothetical protein